MVYWIFCMAFYSILTGNRLVLSGLLISLLGLDYSVYLTFKTVLYLTSSTEVIPVYYPVYSRHVRTGEVTALLLRHFPASQIIDAMLIRLQLGRSPEIGDWRLEIGRWGTGRVSKRRL